MNGQLRQVCSWCEKEGVVTVIQEGDEPTSHGICAYHAQMYFPVPGL